MAKRSFGLKNFLFSFVIVCIVIYIFQNGNGSVKTIVAEKGTLEDIINAQGIVIKDEEVFCAGVDGNITYYHNDGEKVNKGLLIADINTNSSKIPCYSGRAGIITYKVDGLEDVYKYQDVLNLTSSSTVRKEFTETDSSKSPNVKNGDKLFKIISGFDYYIAATLSNEYAKLFEENKYVKIRVISNGTESDIWGYIKKINYGSEESVIILYFDDYFYKIYDKRYIDLQMITDIHEGLKIDSKAICEKDGVKGVYVVDISNIVKFFPVQILGQNDKDTVVYEGDFVSESQRRTIKLAEKTYETIKIFDKIVLDPDKVYEGQIVK